MFVHCALNIPVSVFVLLHRVLRQAVPLEQARETMLQIWQPSETWQRFIDAAVAPVDQEAASTGADRSKEQGGYSCPPFCRHQTRRRSN
jgi:hypothetical protein